MAAAAIVRGGIHHLTSTKLPIEPISGGNKIAKRKWIARATSEDDPSDGPQNEKKNEEESFNWDKAWASYQSIQNRKKKSRPLFNLDIDKFVSRSPIYRNYPLSEEVDPIRKDERSFLESWTDPKFTAAGFSVVVALFVYMFMNAPPHA